jgi:nucleoside-diphosphate-sugar epimerase
MSTDYGITTSIARVFSVFDHGMKINFLAGRLEDAIKKNLEINIKNADDVRDFSTCNDISRKLNILSRITFARKEFGAEIVNVGSGQARSVKEQVIKFFGLYKNIGFISGNSEMPYVVANISKFKNLESKLNEQQKHG